jgi:hypothetical protein
VLYDPASVGLTVEEITEAAKKYSPPISLEPGYTPRFVLHYQIDHKAVDDLIEVIRELRDQKPASKDGPRQLSHDDAYQLIYQSRPGVAFD